MCRWGFSRLTTILKAISDERLRAYVIWDPIFGGNFDRESRNLARSFPDKRVSYFKDPGSLAGNLWERVLQTGREITWDVYLLYGADAQWNEAPPPPDFWMHQLTGVTIGPRLDDETFTAELRRMLDKLSGKDAKKAKP